MLILANYGFAQTHTYFDFEEATVNFNSWAGATWEGVVENPSPAGVNVSQNVGLATSGTETWAGINHGFGHTMDFSETHVFTMDVYSAEAGFITMQLLNKDDKDIKINAEAEYTTPGNWQTLTFDFTGGLNHVYSSITFWIDSKNTVPGKAWYIDNLQGPELSEEGEQAADARLSALTTDTGTLTPAFSPEETAYTLTLPEGTTVVDFTATANNPGASISGAGAVDVSLSNEPVSIVVTSEDGTTTMTYVIAMVIEDEDEDENGHTGSHPGHYVTLENNYTTAKLQDALSTPGLRGVQIRYAWKSLETAEGVYDFSKIETALQMAADAEKYLIVFPVDKSFRAGEKYTPEYLWDKYTAPTGRAENGEKGYIATRWDSHVVERMALLMDTLAGRFDEEHWFEGVAFQESATGLTANNKVKYNYTPEKYRDALIEMLIRAKKNFENSQVFWYMNYLEGGRSYIGDIADTIAQYDILMGGPDILPDQENLHHMVYTFYEAYKDKMDLFCSVQNDSYHHRRADDPSRFWTLEEIFLWGRDNLYIDYCFWNYVDWSLEEGAYRWDDAKPVILKYTDFEGPEPDPDESAQAPYGDTPMTLPGRIEAEDFDNGGEAVAFGNQTNSNTGATGYRPEAAVVGLEEQADGAVTVGYTGRDEWLEYTVDVAAGTYDITIAYATGIEDPSDQRGIKVFLDAVEILDFDTAVAGGDWTAFHEHTIKNVHLPETAGGIVKIVWKTDGFNLDYLDFKKQVVSSVAGGPDRDLQFVCYANPFSDHITFRFNAENGGEGRLSVHDLNGRNLYSQKITGSGKQQLTWDGTIRDGTKLLKGIYFVTLNINGKVLTRKIIKN